MTPRTWWLQAIESVLLGVAGALTWLGCWMAVETPGLRHALHSWDPLCWRCVDARRRKREQAQCRRYVEELHRKEARRG